MQEKYHIFLFNTIILIPKDNIDYMAYCKSKDLNRRGSLMFDDLKFINSKIKLAFNESDYELIRRKYDRLANNEIHYESLIADMDAPYKGSFFDHSF